MVNPAMSLHVGSVLMSVNTTCRVCKVSSYILHSVNTGTALVDYVSHNVHHVQRPKYMSFTSKVSATSNFTYVSFSPLYTILVAILFNIFSLTLSVRALLVCNELSIIALFLIVYVKYFT